MLLSHFLNGFAAFLNVSAHAFDGVAGRQGCEECENQCRGDQSFDDAHVGNLRGRLSVLSTVFYQTAWRVTIGWFLNTWALYRELRSHAANGLDEELDVFEGRFAQEAMAQIEDVAFALAGLNAFANGIGDFVRRAGGE